MFIQVENGNRLQMVLICKVSLLPSCCRDRPTETRRGFLRVENADADEEMLDIAAGISAYHNQQPHQWRVHRILWVQSFRFKGWKQC